MFRTKIASVEKQEHEMQKDEDMARRYITVRIIATTSLYLGREIKS